MCIGYFAKKFRTCKVLRGVHHFITAATISGKAWEIRNDPRYITECAFMKKHRVDGNTKWNSIFKRKLMFLREFIKRRIKPM